MGKITGLLMIILTVLSVLIFVAQGLFFDSPLWFPVDISAHGAGIDAQFNRTLIVVGIAFTAAQIALGYAVIRYGRRGNERAVYSHGSNKLEATWTIITAVVFIVIAILGQRVWAQLHFGDVEAEATRMGVKKEEIARIGVVAQQFKFTFHYPGKDGLPGKTDPKFYNDGTGNFVGLAPADASAASDLPEGTRLEPTDVDPNAADDVQTGTLVLPVGRPVELTLRSKDVIHNIFIPVMRFKQDTVPGLAIKVHFTATGTGRYEIPCAELCGTQHNTMKAWMLAIPAEEYDRLMQMAPGDFISQVSKLEAQYGGQPQ